MPELVEKVAQEIETYGEGLVPELRIVCTWLASHFRKDEDVRAALNASGLVEVREALAGEPTIFLHSEGERHIVELSFGERSEAEAAFDLFERIVSEPK